jgi:nitrite reductase/ring-hydroxylating ferredoxin subunit
MAGDIECAAAFTELTMIRISRGKEALALNGSCVVNTTKGEVIIISTSVGPRAYVAVCPHRGAPLSAAVIIEGVLVCPWHRALYSIQDGKRLGGPEGGPLDGVQISVSGADLILPTCEAAPGRKESDERCR